MELIETTCQSCGNIFNRERRRGRPPTKCPSCRDEKQSITQFAMASGETVERKIEVIDGITYIEAKAPCVGCGNGFMHVRKKGRPPTRCADCQEGVEAAKAAEITTSDERLEELFQGPKELLQGTPGERPVGAEAQCPTKGKCGRIFTSNTSCDDHKRWLPNGSYECIDPATLGMEPRSRKRDNDKDTERIVPVWTRPTPVEA